MSIKNITNEESGNIIEKSKSTCPSGEENSLPTKYSNLSCIVLNALFFIWGTTSLLSWNAFVTNTMYFKSEVSSNTALYSSFNSSMLICSMIPLIFGNLLNVFVLYKIRESIRIIVSIIVFIIGFILTILLVSYASNAVFFFTAIMILSCALNLFSPIMAASFFNILAYFPISSCLIFFLAGQSFSGILVSILQVIITSLNLSPTLTAIVYFSSTLAFLVFSLIAYLLFIRSNLYINSKKASNSDGKNNDLIESLPLAQQINKYLYVIKIKWVEVLGMYINMTLTLAIWPVIPVTITSSYVNTIWADKYFLNFMVFVMFSVGDFIGKYIPRIILWPRRGSIWNVIVPSFRLIFFFLFLMCIRNTPHSIFLNIFKNDVAPIIFVLLFSVMNGHLISIYFSAPYTFLDPLDRNACSIVMVLVLGVGLSSGAFLTFATSML